MLETPKMNAEQFAENIEEYIDQVNRRLDVIDEEVKSLRDWTKTLRLFKSKFVEAEKGEAVIPQK